MSRIGPKLRLDVNCGGCDYEHNVSYRVQGDSGHDVYCAHPASLVDGKPKRIADTCWTTPPWCPELPKAKAEFKIEAT